jgi:glutamate-1-semialdehyde 2,1-aminomutase
MSLYERAAIIPGRSLTRSKAVFGLWAKSAHDATITGSDGREYLDTLCALGAVTLGYPRRPRWSLWRGWRWLSDRYYRLSLSREETHSRSGVLSIPDEVEVLAAEAVIKHVAPWASHVRFTVTGSEATHAAYRIAKAATGRSRVLVGDWAYHGWHEWVSQCWQFEHGDDLASVYRGDENDIAAVFIEPHRWEPIDVNWLRSVRAFCDRIGALLVFDEMIWGGRFALGGATEVFGVLPDMATFGKAFGNGQPVAFVVGRDALAQHGEIVSGTYSGYPQGLQAVVDTIRAYTTHPVLETLWARGSQLQEGLRRVIPPALGVCEGAPVHQRVRFFDPTHGQRFSDAMKARGILFHPACANVMFSHTSEQMDRVVEAARQSAATL